MSLIRTVLNDSVIIHPPGFYIIGFETFPFISIYFIFLIFVYVVTVLFNVLVIYVITFNHSLHTPKFLAVANLAFIDLVLSTTTIPSMIKVFLLKDNFIPFNLCLIQMYVYFAFVALESLAIAILAYDRLIAICFPLRQNSINTLRSMSCILGLTWCFALGVVALAVSGIAQLSFCSSLKIFSYFCDYAPVLWLGCNDYTLQWTLGSVLSTVILGGPFTFIFLSYVTILVTVFRMKSLDNRRKALSTCVEHLILVAVFYLPHIIIYTYSIIFEFYGKLIDTDQRVLSLSLASCLPPCVNPMVYSLKTKEIKSRVMILIGKLKIGTTNQKRSFWKPLSINACLKCKKENQV